MIEVEEGSKVEREGNDDLLAFLPRTYTHYCPVLGSKYTDGCGVMRVSYPRSGRKKSPKPWKCGIDFDEKRVAARTGLAPNVLFRAWLDMMGEHRGWENRAGKVGRTGWLRAEKDVPMEEKCIPMRCTCASYYQRNSLASSPRT